MSVRVMKRSGSLCVVAAILAGLLALNPASAKVARTWLAGASAEKVTPLPFDAKRDLLEFPQTVCPRQVFGGPRAFDFEEPYADLNHDGTFSYGSDLPCDANHNGRWDGLYSSGGVDHLTEWVHDDIWARAVAISDGVHTIVIESVTSQGLFIEDDQSRRLVLGRRRLLHRVSGPAGGARRRRGSGRDGAGLDADRGVHPVGARAAFGDVPDDGRG
ncbi:MAG: hypothetical protein E6G59_10280 [Actinobacteria bacterium]|nr:MAG: hypothetical protein E6G59_10280 [Actinomycetota bacterium]